jgi:hypothetical protein
MCLVITCAAEFLGVWANVSKQTTVGTVIPSYVEGIIAKKRCYKFKCILTMNLKSIYRLLYL